MSVITTVIFDMYDTLVRNDGRKWVATFREIIQSQRLDTDVDKLWQVWRDTDQEFQRTRIQPAPHFRLTAMLGVKGFPGPSTPWACLETRTRRQPSR